jgi:hypothetical protein
MEDKGREAQKAMRLLSELTEQLSKLISAAGAADAPFMADLLDQVSRGMRSRDLLEERITPGGTQELEKLLDRVRRSDRLTASEIGAIKESLHRSNVL